MYKNLLTLHRVNQYSYTHLSNTFVFDAVSTNVQYGTPYATCHYFFTLKSGARYFKLEEVKV